MAVVALGFFDGAHIGHQALFAKAKEVAALSNSVTMAATFNRHPDELVTGKPVTLINSNADRYYLLHCVCGMDEVRFIPFDQEVMCLPWELFIENICLAHFGATHLICGEDFTFGHYGQGNAQLLKQKCAELNIGCDVIASVVMDGAAVSSTRIRELLLKGDLEQANRLLGHPHVLSGIVQEGRHLGTRYFYPTANIAIPPSVICMPYGGYETRASIDGGEFLPAITNIGINPTVCEQSDVRVETYIIDFEGDLYNKELRLEFLRFLRPEQDFGSFEALRRQIDEDISAIRDSHRNK